MYKVLRERDNKLFSAVTSSRRTAENPVVVEYVQFTDNIPKLPGSKLMVFEHMEQAIDFANGEKRTLENGDKYGIYEVLPTNPVVAERVGLIDEAADF